MQVSVQVCESREGMFEAHLVHSLLGEQGELRYQLRSVDEPLKEEGMTPSPLKVS